VTPLFYSCLLVLASRNFKEFGQCDLEHRTTCGKLGTSDDWTGKD